MMDGLHAELEAIERALDEGLYRSGPWERFVRRARQRPRGERRALAADVSRVSAKLHHRGGRRTVSVGAGVALELAATAAGGALLAAGLRLASNAAVLLAGAIWITTFEPLVKIAVGLALGVRYDYAYLRAGEPRFKMRYGTYLAAPRLARISFHLSGTVGSPLAAWLVGGIAGPSLPASGAICFAAFWVLLGVNVVVFGAAVLGRRRLGPLRLGIASGGAAGTELREALGKG
jgi:hypothetical protein